MRDRTIWFSRSAAVATAVALATACESTATPPKTADDAAQGAPARTPGGGATSAPGMEAAPAMEVESAAATEGYVFKKKMPAVGTKVQETEGTSMTMALEIALGSAAPVQVSSNERSSVTKIQEVLAVSGDAVTKVKVTYKAHSKIESEGGVDKSSTSPVAGKTYLVSAEDGAITVLTDRGAPAPADEAKVVKADHKSLGKPDEMQQALPTTPIRVGERVDSLSESLRAALLKDDGKTKATVLSASVVLARTGEQDGAKTGVFTLALDVLMGKDEVVMHMKMKGEVEMRLDDGFAVRMSLQSPLTAASAPGSAGPKITGSGVLQMEATRQIL